MKENKINVKK